MKFETQISGPIAVIGDVHGQVDQLSRILKRLQRRDDYQQRWIVFLGDLVDRGPDPKGAIDLVLETIGEHARTVVISGNHELAMAGAVQAIETPIENDWAGRWLDHYGSQSTFASYGVPFGDLEHLSRQLPEDHKTFLKSLPWAVEHPEYFFVHSGLELHTAFDVQRKILLTRDFSLNRPNWLCSKRLPFEDPPDDCHHIVVSGHAYVPQVVFSRKRILVDTTGGSQGSMSCVLLPENQVIFADPTLAYEPLWQPRSFMREINIPVRNVS